MWRIAWTTPGKGDVVLCGPHGSIIRIMREPQVAPARGIGAAGATVQLAKTGARGLATITKHYLCSQKTFGSAVLAEALGKRDGLCTVRPEARAAKRLRRREPGGYCRCDSRGCVWQPRACLGKENPAGL